MIEAGQRAALCLAMLCCAAPLGRGAEAKPPRTQSPLERYIEEANRRRDVTQTNSPGSLWSPTARYSNLAGDFRAVQVDDIVTILVAERASAVARGATNSARSSNAKSNVAALGGITRATGPLANLTGLSSEAALDGQGSTSRETVLTTSMSARVTHVLPNGYLIVEGTKLVTVNSEAQTVTVRGVIRPVDLSTANTVASDRLAQLEVQVNGKGVVGDAVRRPFFLYRILLGLLPF